jgi:hypothetical protein
MNTLIVKLRPTARDSGTSSFKKVLKSERLFFELDENGNKTGKIVSHADILFVYLPMKSKDGSISIGHANIDYALKYVS